MHKHIKMECKTQFFLHSDKFWLLEWQLKLLLTFQSLKIMTVWEYSILMVS